MLLDSLLCACTLGLRALLLFVSALSGQKCVHYAMIMPRYELQRRNADFSVSIGRFEAEFAMLVEQMLQC